MPDTPQLDEGAALLPPPHVTGSWNEGRLPSLLLTSQVNLHPCLTACGFHLGIRLKETGRKRWPEAQPPLVSGLAPTFLGRRREEEPRSPGSHVR